MTHPSRVAMLLDRTFPPDPRVANEARSLVRDGHEVHLFCLRYDKATPGEEEWEGIRLHRLLIPRAFARKASAVSLEIPIYRWYLRRGWLPRVQRLGIGILHVHDLPLVAEGVRAARALGVPLVADLHENWPAALKTYGYARRFPGRILISPRRWARHERRVLPRANRIVVVVDEARKRLLDMGLDEGRIAVVQNTVSVDEFEGFGVETEILARFEGRFVLAYLGGFERHRGLETVIEAMPEIARQVPSALLLLVGGGSSEPALRRRVAELGLESRVLFEGWRPFRLFPSYIRASQVCVIPHVKNEHTDTTIPHKLFHTMLLERPVLATDCAPIRRIVEETNSGLIVPSGDPGAMARAAIRLADPALRRQMGEAGRSAVRGRYQWAKDAETLLQLYRELAAEGERIRS